jgi:hypothetical protein
MIMILQKTGPYIFGGHKTWNSIALCGMAAQEVPETRISAQFIAEQCYIMNSYHLPLSIAET